MAALREKKGCLGILFEFGVPPYRAFIFDYLSQLYSSVKVFCADDKFDFEPEAKIFKLKRLLGQGESRLYSLPFFRLLDCDVIITTFNLRRPHTWLPVLLLPWKRWIFWGQGQWRNSGFFVDVLRRILFLISRGYIVYTQEGANNLVRHGYPIEKISVANNTLCIKNASPTQGDKYFIYVGRLQERKGVEVIFPYLAKSNYKLRIVGTGEYFETLKTAAIKAGVIEKIEFFPAVYNDEELKLHFMDAVAYVSPNHVGLGVVHAFSYGVPVITLTGRDHAPEFSYCDESNSYLCSTTEQLKNLIESFDTQSENHLIKRNYCFQYYREKLSYDNVIGAFSKQLQDKTL